jgi:hypothetical protein
LIVARVTAPVTAGTALTANNIASPHTDTRVLTTTQPTNITGVALYELDPATRTTAEVNLDAVPVNPTALLSFNAAARTITYRAPGDAAAGDAVNIGSGGPNFTVYTDAGSTGRYVRITVDTALLPPTTAGTVTDNLTIAALFEDQVARFTAEDRRLRAYRGTGLPTAANPHGLQLADIIAAFALLPQGITLGTQLLSTLAQALIPRIRMTRSTFGVRTEVAEFTGATFSTRLYINHTLGDSFEITCNARWSDNGAGTQVWVKDAGATSAFRALFAVNGFSFETRTAADATNWDDFSWTTMPISSLGAPNETTFSGQLNLGTSTLSTSAGIETPRVVTNYAQAAGLDRTLIWRSQGNTAPTSGILRMYRSNSATALTNTDALELTWNARWDDTANLWNQDAAATSIKLEIGRAAVGLLFRAAGAATWNEASWTTTSLNFAPGGVAAFGGNVQVPAASQFAYATARTFRKSFIGGGACFTDNANLAISATTVGELIKTAGGAASALYRLDLPNGATVTSVILNVAKSAGTAAFSVRRKADGVGAADVLHSSGAAVTIGNVTANVTATCDQNNVVDTDLYSYFISLDLDTATVMSVYRVEVTYTHTQVELA